MGRRTAEWRKNMPPRHYLALGAISSALGLAFFFLSRSFRGEPYSGFLGAVSTDELNMICTFMPAFFAFNIPFSLLGSIYKYEHGFTSTVWSIAINALSLISLVVVSRFHRSLPQLVFALSRDKADYPDLGRHRGSAEGAASLWLSVYTLVGIR